MAPPSLDDLRRRIDRLDDELQDALIERAALVAEIASVKQSDATPALRPGREARILRRLVARHHGPFPRAMLVRIWREMMSGTAAMQTALDVAVYAPANAAGLWDLARDHYGSHVPMTAFRTAGEVVGAVSDGRATLGAVPMPGRGETELWWRLLLPGEAPKPRVIARLPFGAAGNARNEGGDALVIARIEPEPSGLDRSLYVVETGEEISRAGVLAALSAVGLPTTLLAGAPAENRAVAQLFEFDCWLPADEARLWEALAPLGNKVLRVASLGGYARPLSAADLAGPGGP